MTVSLILYLQILRPFLQSLHQKLQHRFPDVDALDLFKIFDPAQAADNVDDPTYGDEEVEQLAQRFPTLDRRTLLAQWQGFEAELLGDDFQVQI